MSIAAALGLDTCSIAVRASGHPKKPKNITDVDKPDDGELPPIHHVTFPEE